MENMLFDYNKVKELLFVKTLPVEGNESLVVESPHQIKEDLLLVPYVLLNIFESGAISCASISNEMLKSYQITQEQLLDTALKNSSMLFQAKIVNMNDMLKELSGIDYELSEEDKKYKMIVVTNENNLYGATALFYPGVMKKLSLIFRGNFYILPSSVHEIIAVPDEDDVLPDELEQMITEINCAQVNPEERLSNHPYHYDTKANIFETGKHYIERIKGI